MGMKATLAALAMLDLSSGIVREGTQRSGRSKSPLTAKQKKARAKAKAARKQKRKNR